MSIEGIYRKKIETVDTDKIRGFEKNTNTQLFDLIAEKREEETRTLESATKRLPEIEKEIEQLKRAKEELESMKFTNSTNEQEFAHETVSSYAERSIEQSFAEAMDGLLDLDEDTETIENARRR